MITFVARNGPPEAMTCPAILCDACGNPIDHTRDDGGTDDGEPTYGWVLWTETYPFPDSTRPLIRCFHYVHGGVCDRRVEAACKSGHHNSRGLAQFLRQLAHNFTHPFVEERNVEYVAPAPSGWRLGHYQRDAEATR